MLSLVAPGARDWLASGSGPSIEWSPAPRARQSRACNAVFPRRKQRTSKNGTGWRSEAQGAAAVPRSEGNASTSVPSTVKCSSESRLSSRACSTTLRKNAAAISCSSSRARLCEKVAWSKLAPHPPPPDPETSGTKSCSPVARRTAAARTAAPANSRTPYPVISSSTTGIPSPSSGPKLLTKSSTPLPVFVNVLQTQDTSTTVS